MNLVIILLSFIGFCISLYAYSVEQQRKKDPTFVPACDISDRISCTKPIESAYGKLIGFSNSILGMIYYPLLALLGFLGNTPFLLVFTTGALIFNVYLAYLLFFKIRSLCLICLSTYAVTLLLFITALHQSIG